MQQKLGDRKLLLCKDVAPPSGVAFLQLPFRCPRCGERQRLRSLSSLRAHLDHQPAYHTVHRLCSSAGVAGCTDRCQSSEPRGIAESAGKAGTLKEGTVAEQGEEQPGVGSDSSTLSYRLAQMVPMEVRAPSRLEEALRAANGTMMRRLQRLSTDLAQVDVELLRAHARFRHLAREKQQVSDRERALCRQVDTAVMEIGRLRERLSLSEQELEKKELEVISIHNFLEAATQHEMCGKVRLQNFIENLLQRISLAERLLEYYHSPSNLRHCRNYMVSYQTILGAPCLHGGQGCRHPERKVFSKPLQSEAGIQAELLSVGPHLRGGTPGSVWRRGGEVLGIHREDV
uniref:Zinc finger protein 365 n=1 Tax=Paramormyrops kingsleyae TaxID=1676925 RepID=A0A3B3R4X7_9TELE